MTTANANNILCNCGHPLSYHATGAGQCYKNLRRTEKRKDHTGKEVKVKCYYNCSCNKFQEPSPLTENLPSGGKGK